jgi:cellulose synthase/poly-beta-1,6-N-acetylglucosamine synthase-like glycosyltransferase
VAVLEWIFKISLYIGNAWMVILLGYNLYLSLFGFRREQKTYGDQPPKARFLILVPAHNEQDVIAGMVQNLNALSYPKELYDFYIIADNCTDHTARIAKELGAHVIVTQKESKDSPTGKPIALKKALEAIPGYAERYDLLMIFDADNLMDANILQEVNSQYICEREPEIIQCYLGSKNRNGLVATFYYVTYTITNRFMNLSKYRNGWNVAVGGTGCAIRTSYLKARGGWPTMSLTEDFEMQIEVTLNGGRILWNHNVRIYDEKPTNLLASFRQRVRWSQGHWYVTLKNTPKMLKAWTSGKISFGEMLSVGTYMYSMAAPVIFVLMLLANCVSFLYPYFYGNALAAALDAAQFAVKAGSNHNGLLKDVLFAFPMVLLTVYSFAVLYWWAEKVDNKAKIKLRQTPMILLSYFANLLNVSAAQLLGLAKHRKQQKWVKTKHKIQGCETVTSQLGKT